MKKIILLTTVVFTVLNIYSQSLTVTGLNSIMYNDTNSLGFDTLNPCLQTSAYLTVKNTSIKDHDILCEKNILFQSLGAENTFCWGGNCYGVGTMISSSFLTIPAGGSEDISFGGYFDAYCEDAHATIEYCFFPDVDTLDRSCIYITYHDAATFLVEQTPLVMTEFYPNPSQGIVNFNYYLDASSTLIIMDILGNNLKKMDLKQNGIYTLDVANLAEGIYFANLILGNEVLSVKKLIVK
tara:strand:+ start:18258 stop:18974 length:717 start_codon:yes stop_codon:yes gene_type:complete